MKLKEEFWWNIWEKKIYSGSGKSKFDDLIFIINRKKKKNIVDRKEKELVNEKKNICIWLKISENRWEKIPAFLLYPEKLVPVVSRREKINIHEQKHDKNDHEIWNLVSLFVHYFLWCVLFMIVVHFRVKILCPFVPNHWI